MNNAPTPTVNDMLVETVAKAALDGCYAVMGERLKKDDAMTAVDGALGDYKWSVAHAVEVEDSHQLEFTIKSDEKPLFHMFTW